MSDWTSGYVADISYTYGYYNELNPARMRFALLCQGILVPMPDHACELGFGQGLSINIHAAASVSEWHGTDFNPSHAGFAQELASHSGAAASLSDEAFAEFCIREDLPGFDFIGLHGIWSWISEENRRKIVDFVRRRLNVGGVLYVSYNTLPGWAAFAPMRHLMTVHAETLGAEGRGIVNRIDGALDFAQKLVAINPAFIRANPTVPDRLKKMGEHSRHYLAHEYFNRDWHPMHFATMRDLLEPAKLEYACSANLIDHIDAINLTQEQQSLLNEIPDRMFRESVRDFIVNQQFRRDYWVKGLRRLNQLEHTEALLKERVVLCVAKSEVTLSVTGALGQATMSEDIYGPILDALSVGVPVSIGDICTSVQARSIPVAQVVEAVKILFGLGHLTAAQEAGVIEDAKPATDRLNLWLLDKARGSGDIAHLASPVTGGGVVVPRIQQLFLTCCNEESGVADVASLVEVCAMFAWKALSSQGQRLMKDGKTLDTEEDNLDELRLQAEDFIATRLPVLRAIKVV